MDALVAALEAQRIPLEQYYTELGHAQQEISTAHASAVQAADEQVLVRETIRGVAAEKELVASLAPKPWAQTAGNGGHVHFAGRASATGFFAEGGLSDLARAFPAGVLEHLPGLCGLTAPSFQSYQRIAPDGRVRVLGLDNREAPVRVPSPFLGVEETSTNAELKACDATCNLYSRSAGSSPPAGRCSSAASLPDPVDVDPARLPEAERPRLLPTTQPRRSTRWPPTRCSSARSGTSSRARLAVRRLSGRPSRGGRGIRASAPLREVLSSTGLVDHHAHGILRLSPRTLDEFRGLFSESDDPRQWPHVATSTYRRAIRVLAAHLDTEPDERAVFSNT